MLTPREEGDIGELSAIVWLAGKGCWNGRTKKLSPESCDYVFVLVGDGRRWFIPSTHFGGGVRFRLGGPKYEPFEIERGDPIPKHTVARAPLQSPL